MSTHTPGPWKLKKVHNLPAECADNTIQACYPGFRIEGICAIWNQTKQTEKNAQLIAAAPDMLKELEGCLRVAKAHYLDMVDQYTDDDPDIEEHQRHLHPNIAAAAMEVKRLETIIYKATGDVYTKTRSMNNDTKDIQEG